jgi:hypothetical protein
MLIGDARVVLNLLRAISQKLGSNTPVSDEDIKTLNDLPNYLGHALDDCEQTIEAAQSVDHSRLKELLKEGTPDSLALKREIDGILEAMVHVSDD